jgi:two-component sensor histidine kinase
MDLHPIELGIDRALPCALILNELLSNAFKHAFPGQMRGMVRVSFREHEPGQIELAIEDDGVGLPHGFKASGSDFVGLTIVRILTRQVNGQLESESVPRTRFVLRFPVLPPIPAQRRAESKSAARDENSNARCLLQSSTDHTRGQV